MTQEAHDVLYFKRYSDSGLLEPITGQAKTQIQYSEYTVISFNYTFSFVQTRTRPPVHCGSGFARRLCIPGSGFADSCLFCVHAHVHPSMQQHANTRGLRRYDGMAFLTVINCTVQLNITVLADKTILRNEINDANLSFHTCAPHWLPTLGEESVKWKEAEIFGCIKRKYRAYFSGCCIRTAMQRILGIDYWPNQGWCTALMNERRLGLADFSLCLWSAGKVKTAKCWNQSRFNERLHFSSVLDQDKKSRQHLQNNVDTHFLLVVERSVHVWHSQHVWSAVWVPW